MEEELLPPEFTGSKVSLLLETFESAGCEQSNLEVSDDGREALLERKEVSPGHFWLFCLVVRFPLLELAELSVYVADDPRM
ncbi:hypothetical protein GW17_00055785 [Ensete ventricosum]|nr:hypothetical protein GW17_00055785 [Ensete ventricosum]RZR91921.1 hypothetical protein BHM03_00020115 [Ensete ventricosum]